MDIEQWAPRSQLLCVAEEKENDVWKFVENNFETAVLIFTQVKIEVTRDKITIFSLIRKSERFFGKCRLYLEVYDR